ncbi:MAG: SMC-Scp complex subunit ScpB [Deltaproteobacteria bacterium]|nr:SMC-Scp complex subunit ScpB [Deltaproteobacteria bacterium]
MEPNKLKSIIEALVLVSEDPLSVSAVTLILEPEGVAKSDVEACIAEIIAKYAGDESCCFNLCEVAGGFQFRTKPNMAAYIQKLDMPKPSKLSQAALETLAIIAYRQPIVRSEIEDIRGVDSGGVLKTLLERSLIKIIGKRDEAGNPLIYGTSTKFLELFNLNSLKELPTLREYEDLEKEHYKGTLPAEGEEQKPLLDGVDAAPLAQKWGMEDDNLLNDLTDSMKKLRRLERDIFPKPVETVVAVLNPAAAGAENANLPEAEQVAGETTENTGEIN